MKAAKRHPWYQCVVPRTLLALLLLLVVGCPRDVASPPLPEGELCVFDEECNRSDCGAWRVCLEGVCETEPSRVIPCTPE